MSEDEAALVTQLIGEQDWWMDEALTYRERKAHVDRLPALLPVFRQYPMLYSLTSQLRLVGVWDQGSYAVTQSVAPDVAARWGEMFNGAQARVVIDSATHARQVRLRFWPPMSWDPPCNVVGGYDLRIMEGASQLWTRPLVMLPEQAPVYEAESDFSPIRSSLNTGFRSTGPAFPPTLGTLLCFDAGTSSAPTEPLQLTMELRPLAVPFTYSGEQREDWDLWVSWPLNLKADPNTHVIKDVAVLVDGLPLKAWLELQAVE